MKKTQGLSDYRQLSIDDRIQFIREICDSIAEDCVGSTDLPGWQKRELDEALKAYSQNPDAGTGWAGVEARIRTGIREVSKRE